ncbi:MAG: hypothetical protein R2911_43470 [Caldilineaceae bacterium]
MNLKQVSQLHFRAYAGYTALPINKQIMGQSWRLDAYPTTLVNNGTVRVQYEDSPLVMSASDLEPATLLHFWNGIQWVKAHHYYRNTYQCG